MYVKDKRGHTQCTQHNTHTLHMHQGPRTILYVSTYTPRYFFSYKPIDILELRWTIRFALKEGHLCRICHCVHFIVQFASALPSQPPLHLSPVPLPLLTCVVDLYSAISSDVLHDIFYTNVLTRFGDYVLRNNNLSVHAS